MSALITLHMYLVGGDDETLYSKEDLLETKDKHNGDKVEILQEGEFYKYMFIL